MTDFNVFTLCLKKLVEKQNLTQQESCQVLDVIMTGVISSTQISAFLTALTIKGETVEEITGFVQSMRNHSLKVNINSPNLIDTAGTGGDGKNTFNISTCSALVAAAAGAVVAKHGNKSITGKSGSSDVLDCLGVEIISNPKKAKQALEEIGIAFLFAPVFHPSMKVVAQIRKNLGFKTVFNLLGPLTNPAQAQRQLIGVYDKKALEKLAQVLVLLGTKKAMLVSSDLDELSITQETVVYEIEHNQFERYVLQPKYYGFPESTLKEIQVHSIEESAKIILDVLNGKQGHPRNIVALNTGAALYVSGIAKTIEKGIGLAETVLDNGKALEKLELLKNFK
ncbi:MAG: anthranilate phosphoribosyltransferase [Candidatus Diapherotrites archaeon]|nr:anthranilate phosphoribosyltransferase [Candidatus Diapherotrites archaeon]